MEACASLANLCALTAYRCNITDISALKGLLSLTDLDICDNKTTSLKGIENLPKLTGLCIGSNLIYNLTPRAQLKNLDFHDLSQIPATDYSPLSGLPKLQTIICSEDQKAAIEKIKGKHNYTFIIAS